MVQYLLLYDTLTHAANMLNYMQCVQLNKIATTVITQINVTRYTVYMSCRSLYIYWPAPCHEVGLVILKAAQCSS